MGDQSHVADDLLELYSLDRLSADELVAVEEHLLVCRACQDRLKETDDFVRVMRAALVSVNVPWEELERQIRSREPPACSTAADQCSDGLPIRSGATQVW